MDSPPAPLDSQTVACAQCKFARRVRMSPNDLQKQLVCRFLPPQNIIGFTPQGPVLIGSGFAAVQENQWCFQFSRAASREEIEGESAPKLLLNGEKTILNS